MAGSCQQHKCNAYPNYPFPLTTPSQQRAQAKYNKKLHILDSFITQNNNNNLNETFLRLQLKPGDLINYYSSTLKQWILNAKIMNTTINNNGTKKVSIEYKWKDITGYVQRRAKSKSIKLLHKSQDPNLIIITTKSDGDAYELLQNLQSTSHHKGIKLYKSENGQITSELLHEINNYKVNIIIFPHYKRRIIPIDLNRRIDFIFKFQDKVHKSFYSDSIKLLKDSGKLIKINAFFLKCTTSINLVKNVVNLQDKFIHICIYIWNKNMRLNVPLDIINLITEITGNIFVDPLSKQDLINY